MFKSISVRLLVAAFAAAPIAAGCASLGAGSAQAQQSQKQAIVVHVGSFTNDLHSTFMAFSLAANLQKAGASVTVFLDREGVRLADVRERGDLTWGDSGTILKAMEDFIAVGGKVTACPHCADLAGMTAANVRSGVKLATQEEVTKLMLDADKVIDF